MKTKMKHHPFLTNLSLFGVLLVISYGLGFSVNLWWLLLLIPTFAVYIVGFILPEKYDLVCSLCGTDYWDKTNYYCRRCGGLLIFRRKEKARRGEEVKPEIIAIPTCSKGHKVFGFDKYCPKCGEDLKD